MRRASGGRSQGNLKRNDPRSLRRGVQRVKVGGGQRRGGKSGKGIFNKVNVVRGIKPGGGEV